MMQLLWLSKLANATQHLCQDCYGGKYSSLGEKSGNDVIWEDICSLGDAQALEGQKPHLY